MPRASHLTLKLISLEIKMGLRPSSFSFKATVIILLSRELFTPFGIKAIFESSEIDIAINLLFKELINNSWHGVAYAAVFTMTNIVFVISIENTNVANTLIMIALAPMLSAVLGALFLKENPDKKTWLAIVITTLAVIYIFIIITIFTNKTC